MVLAIVGILTSVAIPGFRNLMMETRLDSGVDKISRSLSTARNLSINNSDRQRVVICPTTDPSVDEPSCATAATVAYQTGWLLFIDCDNDGVLDPSATVPTTDCNGDGVIDTAAGNLNDRDRLLRTQNALAGVEIESTTAARVIFDRSGQANNPVIFEIERDGALYATVTMNRLGVVNTTYEDFF